MKAYGGVDVQIHIFVTSAVAGGERLASRPGRFTPGERTRGTHWIGDCVGPRAGLDNVVKRKFLTLLGIGLRPLGHPACSQSLYRLCYPGRLQSNKIRHVPLKNRYFLNFHICIVMEPAQH
jgi:hypothetical protein